MSKILLYSINLLLGLSLISQSMPVQAQETPLYLPFHNDEFPGLIEKLNLELNAAKLYQFKAKTIDYWHPYQQGLRRGRPGVYFAAPHFSAWAIHKHQFEPMLKLNGSISYVVAARQKDSHIFEVDDLVGKTVCTQRAPNLEFLLITTAFYNSVRTANTKEVPSVSALMKKDDASCHAFVLNFHQFAQFTTNDPYSFIRLHQSRNYQNFAYVAHPDTDATVQKQLKKFLSSKDISHLLAPMYQRYSSEPRLLRPKNTDYDQSQFEPLKPYWR